MIERALEGDEAAARGLLERLLPVVVGRARRELARAGQPDQLADASQEVWLGLLRDDGRALRAYDPERGASLEGYVGMVAAREVTNRLRRQRTEKRGGGRVAPDHDRVGAAPSTEPTPESAVATVELADQLGEHLMGALPPRGRLVFRLCFTDGLPPAHAARALGVSVQVVYNWQHKIRALSRQFLAAASEPRAAPR